MDTLVARTIIDQLGGGRFQAMTGARAFVARENGVSFRFPRGPLSGANVCRITLNAFDTYDVEFIAMRGVDSAVKAYREGVYADGLQQTFTAITGKATSLGTTRAVAR